MARDNTNTHIFIDTSTTPNKGVEIADLQAVLRSSKNTIGGLITYGNINKWAKYKPFRSSSLNPDATTRQNAHYGLSIASATATDLGSPSSSSSFLGKLVAGQLVWDYLRPRGMNGGGSGVHEWFRMLDFNGYYHDSICPVGDVYPVSTFTNGNGIIAWDLPNLDNGNIQLSDFSVNGTALTNFYLGVLLYQSDSRYNIVTSDSILGTGDVEITLSGIPSSDMGTWRAYPFFSSVQIAYGGQTGTGVYVSAGWTGYEELTFRDSSSYFSLDVFAEWNSAFTQITYQIYATNELSTQQTLENVTIHIRKNQDGSTPPTGGDDVRQITIGTIVVPAASGGDAGIYTSQPATISQSGSDHATYTYWIGASATGRPAVFMPIEETEEEEL